MRFKTEIERVNHPQACLIPPTILNSLFEDTLSELQLDLMRIPLDELTTRMVGLKEHNETNKSLYLICIIFSHPSASDDELIHLAKELGLTSIDLFRIAALIGRISMINRLTAALAPTDLLDLITADKYSAFYLAAYNGHLPIMERLIELAPAEMLNMITTDKYRAFRSAARGGQLPVIERLMALAPADILNMIISNDYEAFSAAAAGGNLPVLERLLALAPTHTQNMIKAGDYLPFNAAAMQGHLPIMEKLMELAPTEVQNMIKDGDYAVFRDAALSGSLPIMERLMALAPTAVPDMIKAGNYSAFQRAAVNGNLHVMNRLIELAPAEVQNMIKADNYCPFHNAAWYGSLPIMEKLMELAPTEVQNMIKSNDYSAFRLAALRGHLTVMDRLMELAPTAVQDMIKAESYEAFREAAGNGHLDVMEKLMTLAPTEVQNMIKANNYSAFHKAAEDGHLLVMARLMALAPDDVQDMIKADNYGAFIDAASNNRLSAMDKLIELAPAEKQNMINANGYEVFRQAAWYGHLPVMQKLMDLAPAEVRNMIKASDYQAFRRATSNGDLPMMKKLLDLAAPTDDVISMIISNDYAAFGSAASFGHLAILEWLITLAPPFVDNMIKAGNYSPFYDAARCGHLPIVNRLLSFPTQMAHAEMHEEEFRQFTHPYITDKLALLRSQRLTIETANPHAVFDVADAEDAKCYFYIIRNLIRRNDPALLDDLRFLLEIPAVKALAHQAVYPGQANELIRLALTIGNQAAAAILLTIPAVNELAARQDYYRTEARGEIDLGALARDRESSMHALSTNEQDRIATAIEYYKPMLQSGGIDHLFTHLLEELAERYQKNPAKITIHGIDIVLPVDWETFVHLELTEAQRQDALKAYYQHKDHSALRYLSCPNPWMAPNASYVYINDTRTQRWSTFEDYKPLIVMLWLAAQDVTIAPTDGHTLEGRITHFVDELAQIGRAHNWDHSRNRVDSSGCTIDEEYDDLVGDKPSCFSGVKRRLFQSVIGHPLLKILTEQDIKQELRDFVRAHFTRLINDENKSVLLKSWIDYCVSVELSDAEPLRALNITPEQQTIFVQQLTVKYGHQFSGDVRFRSLLASEFALVESTSNPSDCMHALKFAALVNLESLLPTAAATAIAVAPANAIGFFAGALGQAAGTDTSTARLKA